MTLAEALLGGHVQLRDIAFGNDEQEDAILAKRGFGTIIMLFVITLHRAVRPQVTMSATKQPGPGSLKPATAGGTMIT